jgi:uncharacterized protein
MLLAREFCDYLARQVIKRLVAPGLEILDPQEAANLFGDVIIWELEDEDRLNDEVREILSQYGEQMRTAGASYQELFKKAKNTLMAQRKMVRASGRESGDKMKLSRDKINDISHKLVEEMKKSRACRIRKDLNDSRLQIVKLITEVLQKEEQVDEAARKKITSQKRSILEGTQEWDLLHRRYYAEELKNFGIDLRS